MADININLIDVASETNLNAEIAARIAGDASLQTQINAIGGSSVLTQTLTDGDTTHAPSGNVVYDAIAVVQADIDAHEALTNNPHIVTKSQIGLGNVDNTNDANKPISTAQQTALDLKVDKSGTKVLSDENYTSAEKTKLSGIATGATANSSDATLLARANHTGTQAISTVTGLQTDLDAKELLTNKDANNGYAGLTLFKINFKNALNTFTSFFTNSNTASRTYTFPDKDMTAAGVDDVFFTRKFTPAPFNPADSTTYYFSYGLLGPTTTAASHGAVAGRTFVIVGATISASTNTVSGTTEDSTMKIRNITQSTSPTIGTFKSNGSSVLTINTTYTGLNIPIAATDTYCIQVDTAAFATNPTSVRYEVELHCKLV